MNNRRDGWQYDAAGNLINDGGQQFQYDAAGRQTYASLAQVQQVYDGDGQRIEKVDNGVPTYYLRSSVLGGQVVCEIKDWGCGYGWYRGYVYLGGQLLAIQYAGVSWVAADPMTKSQRITDANGNIVSTIDLDPWGGETSRSSFAAFQPHRYTTYERDGNGSDQAGARTYHGFWLRFYQPDPYAGSYSLTDPQSFNRYRYTQDDPVNFVDPTGLDDITLPTEYVEVNDSLDPLTTVSFSAFFGGGGRARHDMLDESPVEQSTGGTPQQPVPLAGDRATAAYKTLAVLLGFGSLSDDCQQNVLDKLSNTVLKDGIRPGEDFTFSFDAGAFTDYVAAGGNFYDGVASQIDTFVRGEHRSSARTFGYADKLTAYFNPERVRNASTSDLLALLFHEALHGFGDNRQSMSKANETYADGRLQAAFGLEIDPLNTLNITQYIQEHCFPVSTSR